MFGNTDSNQTRQTKVRAGQYGTIERVFVSNPTWIHTVTGDPALSKKNGPIQSVLPLNLILYQSGHQFTEGLRICNYIILLSF
jgi:hypothetical protein